MAQHREVRSAKRERARSGDPSGHHAVQRSGRIETGRIGLYADPEVYDILHAPGTAREVLSLERIWRRLGDGSPRIALEPACGTGRYLAALRPRGWDVLGFDADLRMVRYAQRAVRVGVRRGQTPLARVWVGRLDDFASEVPAGSVGLAFCPINSIRHVSNDGEMVRHLRSIRRCLHPRGVYAVGISLSAYGLETPSEDVWVGKRAGVRVKQVVSYTPARGGSVRRRGEEVISVIEVGRRGRTEMRSSNYSLLSYSRREWEAVIRKSGLRVVGVVNEGSNPYEPGEIGYAIWILARADHPLARSVRRRIKE